jgi:hypothetical protein
MRSATRVLGALAALLVCLIALFSSAALLFILAAPLVFLVSALVCVLVGRSLKGRLRRLRAIAWIALAGEAAYAIGTVVWRSGLQTESNLNCPSAQVGHDLQVLSLTAALATWGIAIVSAGSARSRNETWVAVGAATAAAILFGVGYYALLGVQLCGYDG